MCAPNTQKKCGILIKAIKFAMLDILVLLPVSKEGLFSPKQGRGQEVLLSSIRKFEVTMQGEEIEMLNEFKILDVVLDSRLKFDQHVEKMSKTIKNNLVSSY